MTTNILHILFVAILLIGCNATYQPVQEHPDIILNQKDSIKSKTIESFFPIKGAKDTLMVLLQNDESKYKNIKRIYSENAFEPLWQSDLAIYKGIQLIENSKFHGLNPEEYGISKIRYLHEQWKQQKARVEGFVALELALTQGVQLYVSNLISGKLDARNYHPGWNIQKRNLVGIDSIIANLIKFDRVNEIETYFEPKLEEYRQFKMELKWLYKQSADLQQFKTIKYPGFIIQKGDSNEYVAQLKMRLGITDTIPWLFTNELNDSIKAFQLKHGLTPDGLPGKKTYEFLKWNTQRYINALRVNMERARWLSDSFYTNRLVVNIPAYQLILYQDDSLLFTTKVIVGKAKNETPVFSSDINYLVFNPCWTVPNSIAIDKMLPRLQKDSNYLKNRNMFIGLNGIEQNTDSIDFNQFTQSTFPYKIYQRTGGDNALGKVKFMFSNQYSIYLHDTPSKSLFNKDNRAFSHGCIRVQNAMRLADLLLYTFNNNNKSINYYLEKGYPEKVYLKATVPLSIIYMTCSVKQGQVIFYGDVYAKDYKILADLEKGEQMLKN